MDKIKEFFLRNKDSMKFKVIVASVVSLLIVCTVLLFITKNGRNSGYKVLFSDINKDEAKDILGILQEDNIEYLYNDKGLIKVPESEVDRLRAELIAKGYPKSGFSYDMYIGNTGLMTTESDKKQYTLYDLQDRLGSTIRLFDGVSDAKVTIAKGSERKYVLEDDKIEASASVLVSMKPGFKLSKENASAIKNLVATSVKGMNFTNVSVFDADTMLEISSESENEGNGEGILELTQKVEMSIASNISRVLAKLYGAENVSVSVKGQLDMSKLVSENTKYFVPEKFDEKDKIGLLKTEEFQGENRNKDGSKASGVAGADSNSDIPRYTSKTAGDESSLYQNSSANREWLYDILKEQREVTPGDLRDLTVAVVIKTSDKNPPESKLINLVADASGINREEATDKITVVRSDESLDKAIDVNNEDSEKDHEISIKKKLIIVGIVSLILLLVLLTILIIVRKRRKRKKSRIDNEKAKNEILEEIRDANNSDNSELDVSEIIDNLSKDIGAKEARTDINMKHGELLKDNIGSFVDESPKLAAQLLHNWMSGGDNRDGNKQ